MSQPPADSKDTASAFIVDALVLAAGQLTWEHEWRGVRFGRLTDAALSDVPTVKAALSFSLWQQYPLVRGEIRTQLELTCQRCMRAMQYPVSEHFELLLLDQESGSAAGAPDSFDVWTVNPSHVDVFELVEEQLLLALPLIAKHADERDCRHTVVADTNPVAAPEGTQKPFGNLRDLLNRS